MERALSTLDVFAHFCKAAGVGVDDIDAVATSAIRDADNSEAFLARARDRTGLPIRVLSREQEAHYGFLAAINSTTLGDGCVLDLGGGSMQLVQVAGRREVESGSWRLGAVRMTERFLPGDGPASKKQLEKLRAHATDKLARAPWLADCGPRLVGVGGTVRNSGGGSPGAARAADCRRPGCGSAPARSTSSSAPGRPAAGGAREGLRRQALARGPDPRGRRGDPGDHDGGRLSRARGHGGRPARGRLLRAPPRGRGDPPLLDDVRSASVRNLAALYEVDEAHTEHVAALALGLFDELPPPACIAGDRAERELLWPPACCTTSGCRSTTTTTTSTPATSSSTRACPASRRARSPSSPRPPASTARRARGGPLAGLIRGKSDLAMLDRMATCVRLAEDLERSRDQSVREAHVRSTAGPRALARGRRRHGGAPLGGRARDGHLPPRVRAGAGGLSARAGDLVEQTAIEADKPTRSPSEAQRTRHGRPGAPPS